MADTAPKTTLQQYLSFHALLELEPGADDAAVRKAYRRRALELHPDKNRDNPKKAELLFDAVKKASDVLLDPTLRAEFARQLEAKRQADERFNALDASRQKLKKTLEEREKQASAAPARAAGPSRSTDDEARLAINRLREEGRDRIRLEQLRYAHAQAAASAVAPHSDASPDLSCAVRVSWDADTNVRLGGMSAAESAKGHSQAPTSSLSSVSPEQLRFIFASYGDVATVTAVKSKSRTALVCFESRPAAEAAVVSPPPGFTTALFVVESSASNTAPPYASVAGEKRPRSSDHAPSDRRTETVPVSQSSRETTAPPEMSPVADFASKESDTLARLLQAAAARKKQQTTS